MGPIPARIFWPGLCIALLLLSVGSGVAAVVASNSDGGAQVLDEQDPERRAVEEPKESRRDR